MDGEKVHEYFTQMYQDISMQVEAYGKLRELSVDFLTIISKCFAKFEAKCKKDFATKEIDSDNAVERGLQPNQGDDTNKPKKANDSNGSIDELDELKRIQEIGIINIEDDNDDADGGIIDENSSVQSIEHGHDEIRDNFLRNKLNKKNSFSPNQMAIYDQQLRDAVESEFVKSIAPKVLNASSTDDYVINVEELPNSMEASNQPQFLGNHNGQHAKGAPFNDFRDAVNSQIYAESVEVQEQTIITTTTTTTTTTKVTSNTTESYGALANICSKKRRTSSNKRQELIASKRRRVQSMDNSRMRMLPRMQLPRMQLPAFSTGNRSNKINGLSHAPPTDKLKKAMKKRHSNARQTISSRADLAKKKNVRVPKLNTNPQMHVKNEYYRALCVLCDKHDKFMAHHYMTQHPDDEVFVSRPSPKMATCLRQQIGTFEYVNRKISGLCLFCEEDKTMSKGHWAIHYSRHTGEKLYFCSSCEVSSKTKSDHKTCGEFVDNIFNINSSEGLLAAFICTNCNYLQINRRRMVQHMIKQHKLPEAVEAVDFEKVTLIPNMTPPRFGFKNEFDYADAAKRYSCTICSQKFESANEFENHFDEEHSQTSQEYKCFCGERLSIGDGCFLTGSYILAHLDRHKADLFKCKECPLVFFEQNEMKDHLLNEHKEKPFKYEHIHRQSKKPPALAEIVVEKMTCKVCNLTLTNPTCAVAIDHFKAAHQTDEVSLTGYVSTKVCRNRATKFSLDKFIMKF